jgi:mRNA interferase MazF
MIVAAITTNLDLAAAPGNVALTARNSGLARDSVVNVSQVLTIDRTFLTEFVSSVSAKQMARVDQGLRLALAL